MAAGCERLVHPSVQSEAERGRQRRLLGVLLAAPFVAAAALMQAVTPLAGTAVALATICALFGASWLIALSLASSGRATHAQGVAVAAGTVLSGLVVALLGGAESPAMLLLAAPAIEAFWISRSREAGIAAAGAGAIVLLVGQAAGIGTGAEGGAWHWISPAFYLATLLPRLLAAGEAGAPMETPKLLERLDAVVARLNRAGEVDTISAQTNDILQLEPELLLGSGLFERIHVADRVGFLCAVSEAREGASHRKVDLRIRMPARVDGQAAGYRAFSAEVIGDGAGEPVAVIRDVQETAELRRSLAEAVEQAGATEVAKGRFLAAVSHELRTPLNAIIGFSDMLLHEEISGELGVKQAEHVTLIREAGNHLLSVVNAILDVSKIESGAYQITAEPFGLQQAADLCCAMLKPQADAKGITLGARVPFGLADVMGDQRAVQQILLNLLSNAIKFTPEGGSVTISAAQRGEAVEIFVSDTGIGIAAEDLDKLGKPFMQVQNDYTRQFQGTGLGLSLVKGLVRLHDGTMSIESAPGLGTCVAIGLPAADVRTDDGIEGAVAELVAVPGGTGESNGVTLRKIA